MDLYKLIFSKDPHLKYLRHFLFWLAIYVLQLLNTTLMYLDNDGVLSNEGLGRVLNWQIYTIINLLFDIAYTYLVAYRFVPEFLQKKLYRQFVYRILAITFVVYVMRGIFHMWFFDHALGTPLSFWIRLWFYQLLFSNTGSHIRCALFLGCKMLKNAYEKMEEKLVLVQENVDAELQLLKAQIHPHFLFNTLNNIYSFSLDRSPQAGSLILKLSDTLKYMINDCETELVLLEKEIKMLQDYIGLEKVRYGKRLNLHVDIKADYQVKYIAPLLLIPFVENSFKHGSSKMLEHPWIRIVISAQGENLQLKIGNSKPVNSAQINGASGIGLKNVRKRLELLYHEDYHLEITNEVDSFHVELRVPLTVIKQPLENNAIPTLLNGTYATA